MDDKQLEEIIQYAENGWYDSEAAPVTYAPSFVAARADLAAMRQPITAEALTAAGWVKRSPNTDYWWSKNMVSITNDKGAGGNGRWTFFLYESRTGVTRCHPENMYDLGELVRLLGGAA